MKKLIYLAICLLTVSCNLNNQSNKKPTASEKSIGNIFAKQTEKSVVGVNKDIDGTKLLDLLQKGGSVIYIRHTTTERDYADQADPKISLFDCKTQRQLSLQGIREAHSIINFFRV